MAERSLPKYTRGRRNTHRSSSSSTFADSSLHFQSSRKFQSNNPTNHTTRSSEPNSNPNDNNITNWDTADDQANHPTLVGTCPFMCPVEERVQRERLRDLAVFERLHGNPRKSSPTLAVKKFCRTISAKHDQASNVRPLSVLEDTLNYLSNLWDSTEHPFEVVHDFIFDRTRSIRQDLSMQNIVGGQVIQLYERMVKFHVISHHKLRRCCGNSNISSMHHLNMEQLTKAVTSLYNLYEANRTSHSIYENEAEFRSFYVLLHLGSDSQPMGESISLWFRRVPSLVMKSKEMCFARRVLRYFRLGNYKHFICTTEAEASYLQYCIIEPYICEVVSILLAFLFLSKVVHSVFKNALCLSSPRRRVCHVSLTLYNLYFLFIVYIFLL
ncbi:unnamed protein product [Ilex paraguariensis]|uniref:SAC3/GANP/THP3 conserved domain-containing protein n=1 Tax=Ilex paraguariensis TaxID=185542 RepID=A0ABC8RUR8_9AQUA